ncbi:C-terminal helicase domain-containing protein [Arcanobacterium hippocoleae]
MAIRQAAMISSESAKIARIKELLSEAKANGKKAIVYSYFLRPLEVLQKALEIENGDELAAENISAVSTADSAAIRSADSENADNDDIAVGNTHNVRSLKVHTRPNWSANSLIIGPLTGSASPDQRQAMVDKLTAADPGAVLLAQIGAGGVGLNIQAANVVIICEPQLKPTTEWQAIARSYRMGQTSAVHVYRLLSEKGLDALLHRRLAEKANLFDEYADVSETALAAEATKDLISLLTQS